ncbi:MAG: hypothetical protein QM496_01055 [Verrucomicrobiota bacterium]
MRILFTNNTLDKPAGTELSVFDYARLLKGRGHEVAAFSRQQGEVADRLRDKGVVVIDSLEKTPWKPDVIHGHHEWETSLAALHFPQVPVISFHRGTIPWQEAPCLAPNVIRWVAVDVECQNSLLSIYACEKDRVQVILNGVDLDHFSQRTDLLGKLERVLVFSNYAKEDNFLADIRKACELEGVICRAVGAGVGEVLADPRPALQESDLVFAKGKAALEAVVSGCGLVVCDAEGLGPLISPENFTRMRNLSFAYDAMTDEITVENVQARLQAWNAKSSTATSKIARDSASLGHAVDQLESLYKEICQEWVKSPHPDIEATTSWATAFFSHYSHTYKLGRELQQIWRTAHHTHSPELPIDETIEMHRIMYAFREQEKRVTQLEDKLHKCDTKISTLKEKLEKQKGHSTKWWQKF